ncbi:MAG TPA: esterase-like activity of phytase family protein [Edaphobacter sp.]
MKTLSLTRALAPLALASIAFTAHAQVSLIAKGTLTSSRAGSYTDLSGLRGTLENGVPADILGGLGSGLGHISGDRFLVIPDRGPNAVEFNAAIDNTASYIDRFHTIRMNLKQAKSGAALPFTIKPELEDTQLLYSITPLVYGTGTGLNVPDGEPRQNNFFQHYFTGRSDNYNPKKSSGDPNDARLDPESIRLSNDGLTVFISDEYGPYVYQFLRFGGARLRTFTLPQKFFVSNLSPVGQTEIDGNTSGRTANKGMEGLAITPDGRTLVGIMQAALIQDANLGGAAKNVLRLVTIDIASGKVTHEYAYNLTTGSGVSDIVALNNHEFLVDERDGKGLGDGSKAKVKQIFKVDIAHATDTSKLNGTDAAAVAVPKTLFADLVQIFTANGITPDQIPSKIEGIAFGEDVRLKGKSLHTLWIANDNDFLQDYSGPNTNPNQFFVLGFTDKDLDGSEFVPQKRCGLLN